MLSCVRSLLLDSYILDPSPPDKVFRGNEGSQEILLYVELSTQVWLSAQVTCQPIDTIAGALSITCGMRY